MEKTNFAKFYGTSQTSRNFSWSKTSYFFTISFRSFSLNSFFGIKVLSRKIYISLLYISLVNLVKVYISLLYTSLVNLVSIQSSLWYTETSFFFLPVCFSLISFSFCLEVRESFGFPPKFRYEEIARLDDISASRCITF